MTSTEAKDLAEYYKKIGFDILAAKFNEIAKNFSDNEELIASMQKDLSEWKNKYDLLNKTLQEKEKESDKNE